MGRRPAHRDHRRPGVTGQRRQSPCRRQFKDRVTALGAGFQVPDVTRNWAQKMYNARSSGLHGGRVQLFETTGPARTQAVEYVIRLEDVLRRAVRRCIEDPDFRAHFADDAAVMAWCPVPEPDDGFLNC